MRPITLHNDQARNQAPKKRRVPVYLRVIKGGFAPADRFQESVLRQRGYRIGDLLKADLIKPRNPKFNNLVHRIGQLVVANIEAFDGLEPHAAIKRLQIEGRIACDEIGVFVPRYGMVIQSVPRSLSFESMDEAEYQAAAKGICRTIAERYWHGLSEEQIAEMAESMVQE